MYRRIYIQTEICTDGWTDGDEMSGLRPLRSLCPKTLTGLKIEEAKLVSMANFSKEKTES
jgi:hypothetical protein